MWLQRVVVRWRRLVRDHAVQLLSAELVASLAGRFGIFCGRLGRARFECGACTNGPPFRIAIGLTLHEVDWVDFTRGVDWVP